MIATTAPVISLFLRNVIVALSVIAAGSTSWAGVQNVKTVHRRPGNRCLLAFAMARFSVAGLIAEIAVQLVDPTFGSILVKAWLYAGLLLAFSIGTFGIVRCQHDEHRFWRGV